MPGETKKKLKAEYNKFSDKRRETGQERYSKLIMMQWIACLVGYNPSTQPAVVVDTLEDTQVQDTQMDDDQLQETEVRATSNLDTSDTASDKMATISQGQKVLMVLSRYGSKFDVTGELLDKLIGMQEKIDKMMMEFEMKGARLEEKQMEIDIQIRREEREISLPNDEYVC